MLPSQCLSRFLYLVKRLLELVHRWIAQEEYSHGFLIPVIVAWLLWTRRDAILASIGRPSWTGPALILLAAVMHIIGKLSALYFLSQFGFIIVLIGIVAWPWRLFVAQGDIYSNYIPALCDPASLLH